jgi:hypothetical protein
VKLQKLLDFDLQRRSLHLPSSALHAPTACLYCRNWKEYPTDYIVFERDDRPRNGCSRRSAKICWLLSKTIRCWNRAHTKTEASHCWLLQCRVRETWESICSFHETTRTTPTRFWQQFQSFRLDGQRRKDGVVRWQVEAYDHRA